MKKKKRKSLKSDNNYSNNKRLLLKRFPEIWEYLNKNSDKVHSLQFIGEEYETNRLEDDHRKEIIKFLYNDEDPLAVIKTITDGWKFKPYDMIFFIGMGLGYLPIEAIKKDIGNPRIVIIEPVVQLFEYALKLNDLGPLSCEKVDVFIGADINISSIVERYQEIIPIGRNQIVVHPNYDKIVGEKIIAIKQELAERITAVRDNWFTTKKYGQQMFTNTVANLPSLFAATPMKNLRNTLKGIPAVCVAAGPSLDHAILDLKKLEKHTLIIACDSAVNALLQAGIRPHMVVTIDIFETNIDKLKPHFQELSDTLLVYSIESNPDNVRLYLGQRRVAVSAYSKLLLLCLDPALQLESQFPAMTSVSHMAIFSAMAVGADPIIMVGMDLAYSMGKSHSFDSAFFHSLDQKKLVSTYGNNGRLIPTSPQFVADKLLIERIIDQSPVRFINTSINGAYIAGAGVKQLVEIVDSEASSQPDANALLEAVDWKPVAGHDASSQIAKNLIQQFIGFGQVCSKKKNELLDEIDRIEKRPQVEIDPTMTKMIENAFEDFEEKYTPYKHMIKEIMLSDLEALFKKKELLCASSNRNEKERRLEELKLLATHYQIYEKGMDFQVKQLKNFGQYAVGLAGLNHGLDASEKAWDKHIQLARYFKNHGELWQAKREYGYCMEIQPQNIIPYLELARSYVEENLWKPAQEVLKQARRAWNDGPEIDQLEIDIQRGIDGLLEEIKTEWTQGNMNGTRKLLNQYLILRPDDPQTNALKMVIRELDQEFSGQWIEGEKEKTINIDMQTRSKQVVQHIKTRQFEHGVGLLEGMAEAFPESRGAIREQIGDIRVMQKDFKSALWNYTQVLKNDPIRIDIQNKINKIRILQ